MAKLGDLKRLALALPETKEGSHSRNRALRVAEKAFIGMDETLLLPRR